MAEYNWSVSVDVGDDGMPMPRQWLVVAKTAADAQCELLAWLGAGSEHGLLTSVRSVSVRPVSRNNFIESAVRSALLMPPTERVAYRRSLGFGERLEARDHIEASICYGADVQQRWDRFVEGRFVEVTDLALSDAS